jgi:flagellar biosynthesis protein FlhF
MRLKSYFAASVQEAIDKARTELGPEAMLLNSKKIAPEQRHLGAYEVVFGLTDELLLHKPTPVSPEPAASVIVEPLPAEPASPKVAPRGKKKATPFVAPDVEEAAPKTHSETRKTKPLAAPATTPIQPKPNDLAEELAELRRQIEGVKHSLSSAAQGKGKKAGQGASSDRTGIRRQLAEFDFSETLAIELMTAAEARGASDGDTTPGSLQRVLLAELQARIEIKPEVGRLGAERRVMMFVGPPGAGKTTTIAKLAVRLGLERRIPVHLISLDTMRVGGSEQLATYARILGIGFDAIYTTAALGQALEEHGGKLILIDSPGYAPAEMEEAAQVARFLQHYPEIEVQLVLPAYLSASALMKFAQRFSLFNPEKLLFTHLDEVDTTGPIVEYAVRSSLPVSFLADGQSITSDLHEATKSKLTEGIFNVRAARTAA